MAVIKPICALACALLLAGCAIAQSDYDCGTYVKAGQACDNSPNTAPKGKGQLRCCVSNDLTCGGDSEKAGICCDGSYLDVGAACNPGVGKCCIGNLKCISGKCSKPCTVRNKNNDKCDPPKGLCCADPKAKCTNGLCIAPAGPTPCKIFGAFGDPCDTFKGFCCGGNHVSCTKGRCTSTFPIPIPHPRPASPAK